MKELLGINFRIKLNTKLQVRNRSLGNTVTNATKEAVLETG